MNSMFLVIEQNEETNTSQLVSIIFHRHAVSCSIGIRILQNNKNLIFFFSILTTIFIYLFYSLVFILLFFKPQRSWSDR